MNKSEKRNLFTANYFVVLTSLIYFIAKYFMSIEGEWGPETHPLTIWFQKIHIFTVPFLIFTIGMIFSDHVWKRIKSGYKRSRKSGLLLLFLFVVMSLSGYLIQLIDIQLMREWTAYIHIGVSFLWAGIFTYHHVTSN